MYYIVFLGFNATVFQNCLLRKLRAHELVRESVFSVMIIPRKQLIVKLLFCTLATQTAWAQEVEVEESPISVREKAISYEHGRDGVKQNYQQAFHLYCQAALEGDAESAYSLGFMYFNGRGIPRNLGLAIRWFKQAADAGDAHSQKMIERFSEIVPVEDKTCKPEETILRLALDQNPNRKVVKNWVDQIAPHYGIDPELAMAVIRAESGFNISALSNKNAQGLMQLIPETAERFGVKNSWDPIQNIKGGIAYLHWLLRHFDGRVDWVLAAYNAGEGAVERYRGIPPYRETQSYVKKIMGWYQKAHHPIPTMASEKLTIRVEQKI